MRAVFAAILITLFSAVAMAPPVFAQGYDKDSPTDNNNGKGNDPGQSGKAPGHNRK